MTSGLNFQRVNSMELRSYNVERVYKESVKCVLGDDLGVDKAKLSENAENIKSMLSQIETAPDGRTFLKLCNQRKDGETWTPYLQIVEMLIRMGRKLGYVEYETPLNENTIIKIL